MAHPKHKISKTRRNKRRANWNLAAPAMSTCSNCHNPKLPHRVCPHCGYYNGRRVIEVKEK